MRQRGSIPLALLIGIGVVVALFAGIAFCADAAFEDEDERNDVGVVIPALISHEYDDGCWEGECYDEGGYGGGGQDYDQWNNEDRNRNRGRNRGAFSPGPFDRSPVDFSGSCISLNCSGRDDRGDEPPPEDDRRMR